MHVQMEFLACLKLLTDGELHCINLSFPFVDMRWHSPILVAT